MQTALFHIKGTTAQAVRKVVGMPVRFFAGNLLGLTYGTCQPTAEACHVDAAGHARILITALVWLQRDGHEHDNDCLSK